MCKNFTVGIATGGHYGGAYLAEAYAVSPTMTVQSDVRPFLRLIYWGSFCSYVFHLKGRTLQMGLRKKPPDLQLFSYRNLLMFTDYAEQAYPS